MSFLYKLQNIYFKFFHIHKFFYAHAIQNTDSTLKVQYIDVNFKNLSLWVQLKIFFDRPKTLFSENNFQFNFRRLANVTFCPFNFSICWNSFSLSSDKVVAKLQCDVIKSSVYSMQCLYIHSRQSQHDKSIFIELQRFKQYLFV